jgi:tetratricopeptide (TPR) repeat protein
LILAGFPVLIETGYDPEPDSVGWTSHYLTVVGYTNDSFIVMDTYRRPNWGMKFNEVDYYWRQFDRHYLVIYHPEAYAAVASILGEDIDDAKMLDKALTIAHSELSLDKDDAFGWFNLGTILVKQGRYEDAAKAYDEARRQELPWRMLWYQFGPYEAYMQVGRYDDVIVLADDVLKNKESEEAYYYKALALEKKGEINQAIAQLHHAISANKNYELAKQALERLKGGG